mmetsp:Transcript_26745/g.85780  ORF Transcript_26745/g.85780 Transcript_26745/m.85780 type:complete len:320 (+) Transcript_26745:100-1059(+)|eukprot:CAMPEP_0185310828 /NCGR_PEP_ID=MMETSP1363-20130426/25614_1 /TAXON_ID=38817 /ORGANISM="Gephyrocapsa oceanica, Strain RCC1303" /LENGTH=319 /DNA_ID=CAMNT_0027908417 /DNA_START=96 /DNA_END=1055 /DNA_ORIENTATION=+
MPVQVSLIVPQGTTAGQQISFVHTDGRNVSLILPDGVVPGQTLHVNVPDAPPEPGTSAAPPSQKPNKKKRKKKDTGDSDLDASDEEFVPGQTNRQDMEEDHEDDREDGKRNGDAGDAGESSVVKTRPRRSSAAKAAEKFMNSVSDAMFEEALARQSKADEAKRAEQKKKKEERLRQRKAQALLLAKAAAEADQAQEGVDEDEIENIVDVKKGPLGLVYEIKWKGYERPEDNTWEPEGNLHPDLVSDFKRDYPELVKQAEEGEVEIEVVPGTGILADTPLPSSSADAPAAEPPAAAPAAAEAPATEDKDKDATLDDLTAV